MGKVNLVAPWIDFYNEIRALFAKDYEVRVDYDYNEDIIRLYVDNPAKAAALSVLLPEERIFGNITVKIAVIPANDRKPSKIQLFRTAFDGNDAFCYTYIPDQEYGAPSVSYVVFANEVVQYFNDDLSDAHGVKSTLYQEIAKDVFEDHDGVYFCTDVVD